MAERLTERHGKYINVQPKEEIMCSNYCTSCGKADCDHIRTALEKLAHYEDLEEQGRLIELPCAVEDIVYAADAEPIIPLMVSKIGVYLDGGYGGDWESFSSFGKTIFLTPEAAEAALKGEE